MTGRGYDSFVADRLPPADMQPKFLFESEGLRYPERLNAAAQLLAGGEPETLAMLNDGGAWTYRELDLFSGQIAAVLADQLALVPGNRVLLIGPNTMKMFAAWLGILKAGGVVVAAMPILRGAEIAKLLAKAQITHAIVYEDCREGVARGAEAADVELKQLDFGADDTQCPLAHTTAALEPLAPVDTGRDDPALIVFTSGTTGEPKGCIHFQRDILASADSFAREIIRPQPAMRWSSTAPLAFTFGLGMQYVFPLRFGGTAVTPGAPGPSGLLEAIARHNVNIIATAPTAYRVMLDEVDPQRLGSLETCVSAGEHLPAATWHAWHEKTGLKIIDGIGATEMMHVFISASGEDIRPGSTGRAVPGYTACVLDENGKPLDSGTGKLAVKGPTGCRYLDDPRQAIYVADGWNVTGDTFTLDEDGYFQFVARSDDMIVSSGYNIAGPEVEAALYSHAQVAECAVIGAPCELRGMKVKAFVVLAAGATAGEDLARDMQDHVKRTIAPYKYPREIAFVDALPKTATGKLQRFALRQS